MTSAIPPRYKAPLWMHEHGLPADTEVAQDLTAIHFWAQVDSRTRQMTERKLRNVEGWDSGKELEEQLPELQELYHIAWMEIEAENIRLLVEEPYSRARLLAIAKDRAVDKIDDIRTVAERVEIRLILDIKEAGDLKRLEAEYDNITEYLLSKRSPEDAETGKHPGNYSETAFIIDTLIPVLERYSVSRELIIGVATNFGKAKIAIPFLRTLLRNGERELTQAEQDQLMYVIQSIITSSKKGGPTYAEFKERIERMSKGESVQESETPKALMQGLIYNTSRGGILQIHVTDPHKLKALVNITKSVVDWHEADSIDLAKQAQLAILNGEEEELEEEPDGDLHFSE